MSRPPADERALYALVDRVSLKLDRLGVRLEAELADPDSPASRRRFGVEADLERARLKAMCKYAAVKLRPPASVIRRARQNCAGKRRPGARRANRTSAPPGDPEEEEPAVGRLQTLGGRDRQLVASLARLERVIT